MLQALARPGKIQWLVGFMHLFRYLYMPWSNTAGSGLTGAFQKSKVMLSTVGTIWLPGNADGFKGISP
ncbi:hypothetical protein KSZ_78340 [Dictyobacter formicarum]|uniref:Uncharacterized protein n=1 Tax=Dictyobacter formicarum TaxID=2778368 RepID=A0ABQ3VW79_9CHLR|nr:hypothetical protein KSZ_78340 [Dictyobacter formicarum]